MKRMPGFNKATELRQQLRENCYSLRVVKNRLALRALKEEFPEELQEYFPRPDGDRLYGGKSHRLGPNALRNFIVQNKILMVKAAWLKGRFCPDGDRFDEIASLTFPERSCWPNWVI